MVTTEENQRSNEGRARERGAALLLAAVPVAMALACAGPEPSAPAESLEPVAFALTTLEPVASADVLWASGSTRALRRVLPGTKLLGRIDQVTVREGQHVDRGELLARLESGDLRAALAQAHAAVAMAQAQLENAQAQSERITGLHQRGSATEKDLEDAVAGYHVAQAALAQAQANVQAAEVTLSYAEVRSPLTGWVVERRVEAGDMAAPGQAMFAIEDLSRLEVEVEVPEAQAARLEVGQAAQVEVMGTTRAATVDRIVRAGNPGSRTFTVKLMLDNPDGALRSGMFVRTGFEGGERQLLAVPRSAVVSRGQLDGVFVGAEDGKLELRWVRLGRALEDGAEGTVEVLSGLQSGERVVIDPRPGLEDGMPFREGSER